MGSFFQTFLGPNGLVLLGAAISTAGLIWSSILQSDVNDELTSKSAIIVDQTKEIKNKNEKLLLKSEEIEKLNHEIINYSTGGDSFPVFQFISLNDKTNTAFTAVRNMSEKYSILNMNMRISDLDSQVKTKDIFKDDHFINSDCVKSGALTVYGEVSLGNRTERSFNIFTSTRNNDFTQLIRMKKIKGKWAIATKVSSGNKVLYEKVADEYPRNANNEVDWG